MLLLSIPLWGGFGWGVSMVSACTSIIVSGRVTPDGRPFIFKNRDTGDLNNLVVMVQGPRYRYIGISAAADSMCNSIWSGHNDAGFAIANTAAYNLVEPSPTWNPDEDEREGEIMRMALGQCATLRDFEMMLDSIKAHTLIPSNANFAVMDAQGGLAYYEVGNKSYVKYDVNDPSVAPDGYLVRTNHAMSGDRNRDQGVERYLAMSEFAAEAIRTGKLDFENVIRHATRYLTHGLTHQNLRDMMPTDDSVPVYCAFRDFIPRYITSCAQVIQGVKAGENPKLTVAWTISGSPLTTVAIPLMFTPQGQLPRMVTLDSNDQTPGAPLVKAGLQLKKQLFSFERGNTRDYIDLSKLINGRGTGILQRVEATEDKIFQRALPLLNHVRAKGKADKSVEDFYRWVDKVIEETLVKHF